VARHVRLTAHRLVPGCRCTHGRRDICTPVDGEVGSRGGLRGEPRVVQRDTQGLISPLRTETYPSHTGDNCHRLVTCCAIPATRVLHSVGNPVRSRIQSRRATQPVQPPSPKEEA
jgi:hypothetical protein